MITSGLLLFFDKAWDAFYQITMLIHLYAGLLFVPLCFVFVAKHIKERVQLRFPAFLFILSSFFAFASLAANFPVVTVLFLMILLVSSYRIYKTSFSAQDTFRKKLLVTGPASLFLLGIVIASGLLIFIGSAGYPGGRFLNVIHGYSSVAFTSALIYHLVLRFRQSKAAASPFILSRKAERKKILFLPLRIFSGTVLLTLLYMADIRQGKIPKATLKETYGDRFMRVSNARTKNNRLVPVSAIADSKSCGNYSCHPEIYKQWHSSAHRTGGISPFFKKTAERMMTEIGKDWVFFCAGCHTPAALLSGEGTDEMFSEGVSCLSCHSLMKVDLRGNASYVFSEPEKKYLYQNSGKTGWRGNLSCFLVRLKSSLHREQMAGKEKGVNVENEVKTFRIVLEKNTLGKAFFKTPEFCASCHKVTLPQEFNGVRDVKIFEPGISWETGIYGRLEDVSKVFITCNDCHMPKLTQNYYDDKIKDHRFPGANTALPHVFGDAEMESFMTNWLSGKIKIKELEKKIPQGSILKVSMTHEEKPGGIILHIQTKNTGDGHVFPVGPTDLLRVWLELTVRDEKNNLIYTNIKRDAKGKMLSDSHESIKPYLGGKILNKQGELIDRHRIWTTAGAKDKHVLMPGEEKRDTFRFSAPGESHKLHVEARWLYKKIYDDFYKHVTKREDTAPVVEISHLKESIVIE